MGRRRARRARSPRTYTISYLLSRQPKALQKRAGYETMLAHYNASVWLQRVRIDRRCYSLLNGAKIEAHNLHHFYRTYRLPADPFFPLFFSMKREYLQERARTREDRRLYILAALRSLPAPVLETIKYLGYIERHYNGAGSSPVWQKSLFPGSKKTADTYARYDTAAWLHLFREHLRLLVRRYRGFTEKEAERILACFVLELTPKQIPPPLPPAADVSRSYRRLSMLHHPDRGGNPDIFIEIKHARDALAERQ